MRICKDCKITKPITDFYSNGISKITGERLYRHRCRKCHNLKFRPPKVGPNLGRFKQGGVPWNKNIKGLLKANAGSFKKGGIAWNLGLFKDGNSRSCRKAIIFRDAVFSRDNFMCKKCGSTYRIHAHHIKSWDEFPKLRFDVSNGLTLCNSCHAKLHNNISAFNDKKVSPWNKGLKGVQVAWNKGTVGLVKSNSGSFGKGHIPWSKNNKYSDKSRLKMSIAQKKRYQKIKKDLEV